MKLWSTLLSTDYGLMSLAVILFVLVIAGFFIRYFLQNLREENQSQDQ